MIKDDLLYTLFKINFVLPILVLLIYVVIDKKTVAILNKGLFWYVVSAYFFMTIILSIVNFYLLFGGFGPGSFYLLGSCLTSPVIALLVINQKSLKKNREELVAGMEKYLIPLKLSLVVVPLIPLPFSIFIIRTCDSYHNNQAIPLIHAVENYYNEQGEYPDEIEALIPQYIEFIPEPFCLTPYYWFGNYENTRIRLDFYMLDCIDKKVLAVQDTSLGWLRRYDFENLKWSASDAFDGYCSYLD